jgi:hypothetical protein
MKLRPENITHITLLSPKMATKNILEENLDEELANYLLSLSNDDDYSETDDEESVCGRDQVISDSDDSDIVIKRKKPRVTDNSGDDVCSDEADSMRPPEFSLVDENCDNCCCTNFNYAEIPGPQAYTAAER